MSASGRQPFQSPITETDMAFGAQTLNAAPASPFNAWHPSFP
jgi:hypothetical protein